MIRHDLAGDRGRWDGQAGRRAHRISPVFAALMVATGLLFVVSAVVFVVPSVAALHLPNLPGAVGRAASAPVPPPATPLTDEERALVLSYAQTMRPDDTLVEVRPGVQAKRSNVQGVRVGKQTVYYDVAGHQSFGPVASGRVRESDAVILSREGTSPFVVVLYALKA